MNIVDFFNLQIDESDPKINEVELNTLLKHVSSFLVFLYFIFFQDFCFNVNNLEH